MTALRAMPPLRLAALLLLATAGAGCGSLDGVDTPAGPAPVRSAHPVTMTLLDFEVRSARTQPAGAVGWDLSLDYTSMFQGNTRNGSTATFDGEWARLEFDLRIGITDRLELFAALPILHTTSGFLDGLVEGYHDAFGFGQDDRDRNPRDRFVVQLEKNGRVAWRLAEDRTGFGDVPIGLAFAALEEGPTVPGVLVRGAIEIPIGREEIGFGNGKLDGGIGVVIEKTLGPVTITLGGDWAWVGRPDSTLGTGVSVSDFGGAFANAEIGLTDRIRAMVGLDFTGQPLRGLSVPEGTRDQLMLSVGGALRMSRRSTLRFEFTEDLFTDVSPDFTARIGVSVGF